MRYVSLSGVINSSSLLVNINMAAEEAAHFVNAILRGPLNKRLSGFDQFYRNAVTECLGFLGSKFINEKRKSHSENSLRILLGQIKRGEHKDIEPAIPMVARYLLQHFYLQRKNANAQEFKDKFFRTLYSTTLNDTDRP